MLYRFKRYIPLVIFLCVIGALLFIPVKVPFSFRAVGLIHPVKKWSLKTDFDGNYVSELRNYSQGIAESIISYRFERGDIASLIVNPAIIDKKSISMNDTVGIISSRFVLEQIYQKENQIAIEIKLLQSSVSAEKDEIIEELRQKVNLATHAFDYASAQFERIELLYNDSIIATTEYETGEANFLTSKSDLEIARAAYNTALTGVKPGEARLIEEKIKTLQNELDFLKQTNDSYKLLSPIGGQLEFNAAMNETGEYISIIDTNSFIIYAPVKLQFLPYLTKDFKMSFIINGTQKTMGATIYEIGNKLENIGSQQVVFIKARVSDPSQIIVNGLKVDCTFSGNDIALREYIKRTLKIYLQ